MSQEKETSEVNPSIKDYKEIVDFANKEIVFVRSAYKWAIVILGTVLGLILAVGLYFSYDGFESLRKDMKDFKSETKTDLALFKENSQKEINLLSQRLQYEIETQTEIIKNEIKDKIEEEFDKEKIHMLVEQKAKERIDKIADRIIEQKIKERIEPQVESTLSKITVIEGNIQNDKDVIFDVTNVVGEIALLLSKKSGGWGGGGFSREEREVLKQQYEYLNNRLKELKK